MTIDGLFDAGYQNNVVQGVRISGIEGNGAGTSAIHFRGTEDLGGGLSSSFHLENDISSVSYTANTGSAYSSTSNGAASSFGKGEVSVGLAGSFGQVRFGAINNGGLEWAGMVSQFGTAMGGGFGSVIGANTTYGLVRWSNSVRYDTPNMNGFTASAIVAAKQTNAATTNYSAAMGYNNVAGANELTATYATGPLTMKAVSSSTQNTTGTQDTQRDFGASYAVNGDLTVAAGLQNTNLAAGTSTSAKTVSAKYVVGQNDFLTNFTSLSSGTAGKTNATEFGLGYNYNFSKTTKLYARADHLNDASGISYATDVTTAGAGQLAGATSGIRTYTKTAFGVQVAF